MILGQHRDRVHGAASSCPFGWVRAAACRTGPTLRPTRSGSGSHRRYIGRQATNSADRPATPTKGEPTRRPPHAEACSGDAGGQRSKEEQDEHATGRPDPGARPRHGGSLRVPRPRPPSQRPDHWLSCDPCSTPSRRLCSCSTPRAASVREPCRRSPVPRPPRRGPPRPDEPLRAAPRGRPGRRDAARPPDAHPEPLVRAAIGPARAGHHSEGRILVLRDVTNSEEHRSDRRAYLSILSHELRTPITTIYAGSRLLARRVRRGSPSRDQIAADISLEAARLYDLVEDLLALTRLEREMLELTDEPVSLPRVAESALRATASRAPNVPVIIRRGDRSARGPRRRGVRRARPPEPPRVRDPLRRTRAPRSSSGSSRARARSRSASSIAGRTRRRPRWR